MLDFPIWTALTTTHAAFAEGDGLTRRYSPQVTLLAGMEDGWSSQGLRALGTLLRPGEVAVFFLDRVPEMEPGWSLVRTAPMAQMVWDRHRGDPRTLDALAAKFPVVRLGREDLPEMLELTALTQPGPFDRRTPELGSFYGIRQGGRLAAMAGERLHMPGFTEVSAVCTHPDHQGKGYSKALVARVVAGILSRAETPIIHVLAENAAAIRVYEQVGFAHRRLFALTVVRKDEASA